MLLPRVIYRRISAWCVFHHLSVSLLCLVRVYLAPWVPLSKLYPNLHVLYCSSSKKYLERTCSVPKFCYMNMVPMWRYQNHIVTTHMAADVHNAEIALLGHHRDCHSVRNYNKMTYNSMTSLTGKLHDVMYNGAILIPWITIPLLKIEPQYT